MADSFPFVRITVLGSTGCGKTSLIHSFVNNVCPHHTTPTNFPALFYRVVRLPPESDLKGIPTSVCVEIEDTVAPEVVEEEVENDSATPTKEMKKIQKLKNIEFFFDMSRKNVVVPEGVNDFTPFSIWKPPRTPMSMEAPVYIPLTQGRMGFIIVFDSNDSDSFARACHIHRLLMADLELHQVRIRPYVYFVANKVELNPESEEYRNIIADAEKYTLMKVSALDAKNVKRTFWDLLYLIVGNQVIWEIEYHHHISEESDLEDLGEPPGCTTS